MAQSFIFGGNTGVSYDEAQRKRAIADKLRQAATDYMPKNWAEGLNEIAMALSAKKAGKTADSVEAQRSAAADAIMASLLGGGGMPSGGGYSPAAAPQGPAMPGNGGVTAAPLDGPQAIAADAMAAIGQGPRVGGGSMSNPGAPLSQADIIGGLVQRGLPEHVATGIAMNLQDESALNPAAVGDNGNAFGLAQWNGPRKQALMSYAANRGGDPADPQLQLDFMLTELQGPEAAAGKAVMSAPDAASAATAFLHGYERPAAQYAAAREAKYTGGTATGGGQGIAPDVATLYAAMSNPALSPDQRQIVAALLGQATQNSDPMRQLQMQKAQLELQAMQNPAPKPVQRVISGQEAAKYGLDPAGSYNITIGPDGMPTEASKIGGGGTSVTVNNGDSGRADEGALLKALGTKEGEQWAASLEGGTKAASMTQDMAILDELTNFAPQGPLSGRAAEMFPGFSSAGSAFQSVVKRLAPQMRAVGSGSTSNIEYSGMLESLPQLSANPEANKAIIGMMKAKAQIDMQRADIVRAYQSGGLGLVEARAQIANLDKQSIMTPELKALIDATSGVPLPSATPDAGGLSPAEQKFLNGGN